MVTIILIILTVLFVAYYLYKTTSKPVNYPPGPKWYPLLGSSSVVERMTRKHGSQWKAFSEIAKEYSTKVLGLKLSSELIVVVYGENNIRQVFTSTEFDGRPYNFFIKLRCLGKMGGVTFTSGALWRELRRFTVKNLKNVGFGKTTMEKETQNEMLSIVEYIKKHNNEPICPKRELSKNVVNILWKYVAGEAIREDRLIQLLELLSTRSKAFTMAGGWLNQMPWCRFLFPELSGYSLIVEINRKISDIIEEAIEKHKNMEIDSKDFIYSFLEEMEHNKDIFTEEQLKIICLDLIIAGSRTTGDVLEFAFLAALKNPAMQEKIYQEIKTVIGDEVPCWTDNTRLIYTSAFLLEVHRMYNIVPLTGPRLASEDVIIDGYRIPKNTTILLATGDLYYDTDIWKEPNEFNPERFIDENGALINTEHIYSFGLGRRRCPGDSLARSFIFIMFVGVLQRYRIECCNGVLPSDEKVIGLLASAKPYNANFILRQ